MALGFHRETPPGKDGDIVHIALVDLSQRGSASTPESVQQIAVVLEDRHR
jgi:hypothetical protein